MEELAADVCVGCKSITVPCAFRKDDRGVWYARHRCEWCQRRWEVNLSGGWTEAQRATWYRAHMLSPEALRAPAGTLPWAATNG